MFTDLFMFDKFRHGNITKGEVKCMVADEGVGRSTFDILSEVREVLRETNYIKPQQIVFDPTNHEHRWWVGRFIKYSNWIGCPYRFVTNEMGDQNALIKHQLLQYYTDLEFTQ